MTDQERFVWEDGAMVSRSGAMGIGGGLVMALLRRTMAPSRGVVGWGMSMKRMDVANHARFLTFSCYRRRAFFADPVLRDAFVERIESLRAEHDWKILAWVVMPEHVHLVVYPETMGVGEMLVKIKQGFAQRVVGRWKRESSDLLALASDGKGHFYFWQRGGGYDRVLRDRGELEEKIGYVHMNPVRRGLVGAPGDWAWSSARDFEGGSRGIRIWRV